MSADGPGGGGRAQQRQRTRKDLLRAAARLMRDGRTPTLEEVAEEAMVSRATAYRYFPGAEPLLVEASLDLVFPEAETVLEGADSRDPAERLIRAESAVSEMVRANEGALRAMLAHSVQAGQKGEAPAVRQNRRTPLIEAAIGPARAEFDPKALRLLSDALALVIGTEPMIVFKDVLGRDDKDAARVKAWMIRALVEAARRKPD